MKLFTLTYSTTTGQDPFDTINPIYTVQGDRETIANLYFNLHNKLNFTFVTVRDMLGQVVDMDKGYLEMPLYDNGCLLDFDREKLEEYRTERTKDAFMEAIVRRLSDYLGCHAVLDVTKQFENPYYAVATLKWAKDGTPYTQTIAYNVGELSDLTKNCQNEFEIEEVIADFIYNRFINELKGR